MYPLRFQVFIVYVGVLNSCRESQTTNIGYRRNTPLSIFPPESVRSLHDGCMTTVWFYLVLAHRTQKHTQGRRIEGLPHPTVLATKKHLQTKSTKYFSVFAQPICTELPPSTGNKSIIVYLLPGRVAFQREPTNHDTETTHTHYVKCKKCLVVPPLAL